MHHLCNAVVQQFHQSDHKVWDGLYFHMNAHAAAVMRNEATSDVFSWFTDFIVVSTKKNQIEYSACSVVLLLSVMPRPDLPIKGKRCSQISNKIRFVGQNTFLTSMSISKCRRYCLIKLNKCNNAAFMYRKVGIKQRWAVMEYKAKHRVSQSMKGQTGGAPFSPGYTWTAPGSTRRDDPFLMIVTQERENIKMNVCRRSVWW